MKKPLLQNVLNTFQQKTTDSRKFFSKLFSVAAVLLIFLRIAGKKSVKPIR